MATDLVPEAFQSPTFMWAYHSFNDLMSRFRPTKLFSLLISDPQGNPLRVKGRDYFTGIDDLPEECLVYIFQFLNHKDLGNCESVCKQWKDIIDSYPELWSHVDLQWTIPKRGDLYSRLTQHEKLTSYVNHLVGQSARIKKLSLDFRKYDEPTYNVVAFLVSSGCCANLKSTSIRWAEDCSYGESTDFENSFVFYLSTLKLMDNFSPDIMHIDTQFNWTLDSVNYITKLKNLRVIDIQCVPRVHTIQKWHVDKLLQELENLEEFRLCVTMIPKLVQKFTLQSKSLRVLNMSNCVNLLINYIDLPNLEHLEARGLLCHRHVCTIHNAFCFFDVLQNGCPALKSINNIEVNKSEAEYGLPYVNQCALRICFCNRHNKKVSAAN